MKYYLQVFAIGPHKRVQIDAVQFAKLRNSKGILGRLFDFTENYRVVVEAYKEVERAKHETELNEILYANFSYLHSADIRVALSAPILWYLSSSRYFLDATDKILPRFLDKAAFEAFTKLRHDIYDCSLEYKFIEALRNYSQHRALPLNGIVLHNYLEDGGKRETADIVTSLSLLAEKKVLLEDDKFKKSILDGMPEEIDIIKCLRGHMEGLWRQHDFVIKTHSNIADAARETLDQAIEHFKEQTGETPLGLHAFVEDKEGPLAETFPLLIDWDDARRAAVNSCGHLNRLQRRYVTGKIHRKKEK